MKILPLKTITTARSEKPRVLVFIVAYNAEKTIANVVSRIPSALLDTFEVEVLIIDDASADSTFARSYSVSKDRNLPFHITALFNPVNQGYGGNQQLGYRYAIDHGFDFVALIHGDGQYAPECLPELLEPLRKGETEVVFGSRMLGPCSPLKGGMPFYKFVGNKILTGIENRLLRTNLSEFHSGYRIYSTRALASVPFERNSRGFHFDTEIIIQMVIAGFTIKELPIPTYYGDEICYVNGLRYASDVVLSVVKARMQEMGFLYDRKFDCAPQDVSPYTPKLNYTSPHSLAFDYIKPESRVLDIGCAGGYLGAHLATLKGCSTDGIDATPVNEPQLTAFYLHDLNCGLPKLEFDKYDYILMLDVIEHLAKPEAFLDNLRTALINNPQAEVIISTANVAFIVTRLMLLIGQFNYGKRGILDLTHTRLFTFSSFARTISQSGFDILECVGVPAPVPLGAGESLLSRALLRVNQWLIRLSKGLFSYQMFFRIKPHPSLQSLLETAQEQSHRRAEGLEASVA